MPAVCDSAPKLDPSNRIIINTLACRSASGPHADSQSKRQSGSKGGSTLDPQGFDAAKKVTGRKRHILVDTLGLLLNVVVHSAAMQDRDGALLVLNRRTRCFFPFIKFIFADAGYQGQKTAAAIAKTGTWKLTIVQRLTSWIGSK